MDTLPGTDSLEALDKEALITKVQAHFPKFNAIKLKKWRSHFAWLEITRNRGGTPGSLPSTYPAPAVSRLLRALSLQQEPGHSNIAELRMASWLDSDSCLPDENDAMLAVCESSYIAQLTASKFGAALTQPVDPDSDDAENILRALDVELESVPARQRSMIEALATASLMTDTDVHQNDVDLTTMREAEPQRESSFISTDLIESLEHVRFAELSREGARVPFTIPAKMRTIALLSQRSLLDEDEIEKSRRLVGRFFKIVNTIRLARLNGNKVEMPKNPLFAISESALSSLILDSWSFVLQSAPIAVLCIARLVHEKTSVSTLMREFGIAPNTDKIEFTKFLDNVLFNVETYASIPSL